MGIGRTFIVVGVYLFVLSIILEVQCMPESPATAPLYRTRIVESETMAPSDESPSKVLELGFFKGFVTSFSFIVVSEIGDKTFFIAAIMAMKHSRLVVFSGAMSALGLMTVLSVLFGRIATIIPRVYTYYVSTALFAIFGIKMLREGCKMSPNEGQEELEEVQFEVRKREDEAERESLAGDAEAGASRGRPRGTLARVGRVLLQAFTMTFLAEWGDRSQLATIILAAKDDMYGVTAGGVIGHALCTGIAVLGGRFIAQKISTRTVTIIGGIVFLLFAVSALVMDPNP